MTDTKIEQGFTTGLQAGYVGTSAFSASQRGGFPINISHFETATLRYHDEWLDAATGGGQELLEIEGQRYTRLYAGGVISQDKLRRLGITEVQIIDFLKEVIAQHGQATRLFTDYGPIHKDDWSYQYLVTDREPSIPLTRAKETISYKDTVVFIHAFMLCGVR